MRGPWAGGVRCIEGIPISEHKLAKRAKILTTIRTSVQDMGEEEVGMRLLASACGVSVQTLYNQFGDKDRLLTLAFDDVLRMHFQQCVLNPSKPHLDQLVTFADGVSHLLVDNRFLSRWMFRPDPASPSESARLMAQHLYLRCVQGMHARGEINDDLPVPFLAARVYYRLRGAALEWILGHISDRGLKPLRRCEIAMTLLSASTPKLTGRLQELLAEEYPKVV